MWVARANGILGGFRRPWRRDVNAPGPTMDKALRR